MRRAALGNLLLNKVKSARLGLAAAGLLSALSCCTPVTMKAADTRPESGVADDGEPLLREAYGSINWALVGPRLDAEWSRLVATARNQTNTVFFSTVRLGGCSPNRRMIEEKLGKTDQTSREKIPLVADRDRKDVISFDWYGALGFGFIGELPGNVVVAVGYDPKRDKSERTHR